MPFQNGVDQEVKQSPQSIDFDLISNPFGPRLMFINQLECRVENTRLFVQAADALQSHVITQFAIGLYQLQQLLGVLRGQSLQGERPQQGWSTAS